MLRQQWITKSATRDETDFAIIVKLLSVSNCQTLFGMTVIFPRSWLRSFLSLFDSCSVCSHRTSQPHSFTNLLQVAHPDASRKATSQIKPAAAAAMTSKTTWATSEKGAFVRDPSKFRNWIEPNADAEFPAGKPASPPHTHTHCCFIPRCFGD